MRRFLRMPSLPAGRHQPRPSLLPRAPSHATPSPPHSASHPISTSIPEIRPLEITQINPYARPRIRHDLSQHHQRLSPRRRLSSTPRHAARDPRDPTRKRLEELKMRYDASRARYVLVRDRTPGLSRMWSWLRGPAHRYLNSRTVAAVAVAGAALFYYANLQTVPVSGRLRFNCFSPGSADAMGEEQAKRIVWEVERQGGHFLDARDPRARLVRRVMARLIPVSGAPEDTKWEVRVIDDPQTVNAFVLPGGKVFVYSGLIRMAGTEDGLAAVLGHEIAHNLADHHAERMSNTIGPNLLLGSAVLLTGGFGAAIVTYLFGDTILNIFFERPMGRLQETEADFIGLMMMAEACYDPRMALEFWRRMDSMQHVRIPDLINTHPSHHDRVRKMTEWMPEAIEKRQQTDCQGGTPAFATLFRAALERGTLM